MINSREIQQAYIDLYVQLRKYIWDINVVDLIVDIQLNAFSAFPDIQFLKNNLMKLKTYAHDPLTYDEDLNKVFDDFFDILDEGTSVYCKISQVQEVLK